MSKRPASYLGTSDNQPAAKKPRYNYNSKSQSPNANTNEAQTFLLSTRKPIKSNIKIDSTIPIPNANEFCPLYWFTQRLHNKDRNDFFNILPYEEANGIFKKLSICNNGSITLTNNLINTLDTMQKITQAIHKQTLNSSSKHMKIKKTKKRFVQKQNEIFNTINIEQLRTDHQNYIQKTQENITKHNDITNDYESYEKERQLLWKSVLNPIEPTSQPQVVNNYNHNAKNKKKPARNNINRCNFISLTDDSDEDFFPHEKQDTKRHKKRKKKNQKQSMDDVGKNPKINENMEPHKFWNKFLGYVDPSNPDDLNSIIPELHSDVFPTEIPVLPYEKQFAKSSYNFDMYDNDLNFDNFSNNENKSISGSMDPINNELYFAEMPKRYEYFLDKKCYIDEQLKIESSKNNKYLKQQPLYQHYPSKSLYSHSFDQRILSAIVHECDGLSYMEGDINENKWKYIGTKKVIEKGRKEYEKLKGRRNKNEKEENNLKNHAYKPIDMIEPVVKYVTSVRNHNNGKIVSFEKALRNEICKYIYDGDWNEINKITNMSWNQRQDDECCTTIKSLAGVLEKMCYDKGLNDIDTNVKIGKEIIDIMQNEYETNVNNYNAWREFDTHIEQIENNHVDTGGGFIVDKETLNQPAWRNYFRQKQNLLVDRAIKAVKQKKFVQTKSDNKDQ